MGLGINLHAHVLNTGKEGEQTLNPHYQEVSNSLRRKIKNSTTSMPYGGMKVNIKRQDPKDLKIPKYPKATSSSSEK